MMLPPFLCLICLLLSVCIAQQEPCGTLATPEVLELINQMDADEQAIDKGAKGFGDLQGANDTDDDAARRAPINVDMWFHILKDKHDGGPTQDMIQKQVLALSFAYAPANIQFNYKGKTETVNQKWAHNYEVEAMYKSLRKGSYNTLNFYWMDDLRDGLIGLGGYPQKLAPGVLVSDGVRINWHSMPGGNLDNWKQGGTAIHEAGHWFGLLHPWGNTQNNCDKGDLVADTNVCRKAVYDCTREWDTCPGFRGNDPVHNHMGYGQDSCRNNFSKGQAIRMRNMYRRFRRGK